MASAAALPPRIAAKKLRQAPRERQIVALAVRHAIPTIYFQKEFVAAGGLISYGPHFADGYRQAGIYVSRILNGEEPGELPIVQPPKFEMVINLKTDEGVGRSDPADAAGHRRRGDRITALSARVFCGSRVAARSPTERSSAVNRRQAVGRHLLTSKQYLPE